MPDQITESRISDYLDESYYTVQKSSRTSRHLRDQMKNIMELVQPFNGQRLLDIGSGSGKYPAVFSHTALPTATDFSPISMRVALETAKHEGKIENMLFVQTRGEVLPFRAEAYDKVTALDIVEHINQDEYVQLAHEVYRVLKPGGMFCIYTPNKTYYIEYIYRLIFGRSLSPLHFGLKTAYQLVEPLVQAGYEIEALYFKPNYFPLLKELETLLSYIPVIGELARRRVCIRAIKPQYV